MIGVTTGLEILVVCFRIARIVSMSISVRKVWREDRMDDAGMNMTVIPMTMGCLRMHVEQGNHEQPYYRPCCNNCALSGCLSEHQ